MQLSNHNIKHHVLLLKMLAHPIRLAILSSLAKKEYAVGELCALLDSEQYTISQQLSELRKAHIVSTRRASRMIYYSLANDTVKDILDVLVSSQTKPETAPFSNSEKLSDAGQFSEIL